MKRYAESHSQIGQESFVLNVMEEKRGGYYVEVGGFDAVNLSNTHLLETGYGWTGIALEIHEGRAKSYNAARVNPCITGDATTFNFRDYFIEHDFPRRIDYLQLDIEPAYQTLACLLAMPMEYRYTIITFEHDLYVGGDNAAHQETAFNFLTDHGYKRVVKNMAQFEDWYIDPSGIDLEWIGEDLMPEDVLAP